MDRQCPRYFVQFLGWYESDDFIFCAMEYMVNGDLGQYMESVGSHIREEAKEISRQVLHGLVVLHAKHICHRDLKPQVREYVFPLKISILNVMQNILISSRNPVSIKLADFGISKSTLDTSLKTPHMGTQGYIAPEVQGFWPDGHGKNQDYTQAVDIWAFGCIVHEMLTLQKPFMETTGPGQTRFSMHLFSKFCRNQTSLLVATLLESPDAVNFVRRCLVVDARHRMSAAQALSHVWLLGDDRTSLQQAVKSGHIQVASALIDAGEDVNAKSNRNGRALQSAALRRYIDTVAMLLHRKAEINAKPEHPRCRSALQSAAARGHLDVVDLLLNGADVNGKPAWDSGQTALQSAASGGHVDVLKLLLDHGAAVNQEGSLQGGMTALAAAAGTGCLDIVQILLQKHAEINTIPQCTSSPTALQAAAANGHYEVVEFLLQRGAYVNADSDNNARGHTALHSAVMNGYSSVVKLLLGNGADINAVRTTGVDWWALVKRAPASGSDSTRLRSTAIQLAAEHGHLRILVMFLLQGATIDDNATAMFCRRRLQDGISDAKAINRDAEDVLKAALDAYDRRDYVLILD